MTRCPLAAMIRARLSPMTVDRRCPTCIGLATLGEEKSITTVLTRLRRGQAEVLVDEEVAEARGDPGIVQPDVEEPGPGDLGRSGDRRRGPRCRPVPGARSRGLRPMALAMRHAAVGLVIAELGIGRRAHRLREGGPIGPLRQD